MYSLGTICLWLMRLASRSYFRGLCVFPQDINIRDLFANVVAQHGGHITILYASAGSDPTQDHRDIGSSEEDRVHRVAGDPESGCGHGILSPRHAF